MFLVATLFFSNLKKYTKKQRNKETRKEKKEL